MTEKMKMTLDHIKTSVDVDPWAIEEVERVFKAWDIIRDRLMNYTVSIEKDDNNYAFCKMLGIEEAIIIIDNYLEGKEKI